MNQALLGKWLWMLGDDSDGLWKQLLAGNYGVSRNGWDAQDVSYKASAIWKGILSKERFKENISYRVGSGEMGFFFGTTCGMGMGRWNGNSLIYPTML